MKNLTIIIILLLALLKTQAQDYLISFAGTGESTTVDSVQVKNLIQNTSLTLDGADVLHLMGIVGIDDGYAKSNADLRIYPNPTNENSFIEFEATSSGISTIQIFDFTGKQVAQSQTEMPCGGHTFAISGLRSGIYTVNIKSVAYVYSGKIVCTSSTPGKGKISYVSTHLKSTDQGRIKSILSLVPMQYNNGDQLLFKCFSGIYSTIIPLVPVQSQTITANFVACTDADGNNYATVTIGTQTWMAENLNVGVRINGSLQGQTNNGFIEKYCYNNDAYNCNIYGGLYQWKEMMQYDTFPGIKGICPIGWHIPTDSAWTNLITILGGESTAGGSMKLTGTLEAGTGLWYSPNADASNESGFTAFPGGYCDGEEFGGIGSDGFWWSSSASHSNGSLCRYIYYDSGLVGRDNVTRFAGFSVRCLRD